MCLLEAIMNFTMLAVFTQISRLNNSFLSFSLSICLETNPSRSHYIAKICFHETFTQIGSLSLQFPQTCVHFNRNHHSFGKDSQSAFPCLPDFVWAQNMLSRAPTRSFYDIFYPSLTYVCVVMKRMVMIMMATLIWWWEMWGRAQTEVYLVTAGAQCARVLGNTKHSTVKHSMCAR